MHRAIAPATMAAGLLSKPSGAVTLLHAFNIYETLSSVATEDPVEFTNIDYDRGSSLGLSNPTDTITIPAGVSYAVFGARGGDGTARGNFVEYTLERDGSTVASNINHDGFYNAGQLVWAGSVSEAEDFTLRFNANTAGDATITFWGRLYA